MGKKKKRIRFAENETFPNLFQWPSVPSTPDMDIKGRWGERFFGNDRPIVLELGCGKGDYTVGLAQRRPECNYIGVDIKGARLWRGCRTALEQSLSNVAFARIQIEFIEKILSAQEASEIWITFPDPQPNKPRKRLTSPDFLNRYGRILREGGMIHLKTDDFDLYDYTLNEVVKPFGHELLAFTADLYKETDPVFGTAQAVQTYYEGIWLAAGKTIKYIAFRLNAEALAKAAKAAAEKAAATPFDEQAS